MGSVVRGNLIDLHTNFIEIFLVWWVHDREDLLVQIMSAIISPFYMQRIILRVIRLLWILRQRVYFCGYFDICMRRMVNLFSCCFLFILIVFFTILVMVS